jgi:hypothetical protein
MWVIAGVTLGLAAEPLGKALRPAQDLGSEPGAGGAPAFTPTGGPPAEPPARLTYGLHLTSGLTRELSSEPVQDELVAYLLELREGAMSQGLSLDLQLHLPVTDNGLPLLGEPGQVPDSPPEPQLSATDLAQLVSKLSAQQISTFAWFPDGLAVTPPDVTTDAVQYLMLLGRQLRDPAAPETRSSILPVVQSIGRRPIGFAGVNLGGRFLSVTPEVQQLVSPHNQRPGFAPQANPAGTAGMPQDGPAQVASLVNDLAQLAREGGATTVLAEPITPQLSAGWQVDAVLPLIDVNERSCELTDPGRTQLAALADGAATTPPIQGVTLDLPEGDLSTCGGSRDAKVSLLLELARTGVAQVNGPVL